ncbi:MAG: hypothetical protein ACKVH8_04665 [Pirellulales bacterium]
MKTRLLKTKIVLMLAMVLQSTSAVQACQLTDWLFGRNQPTEAAQAYAPPVITYYTPTANNYVVNYPVATVGYTQPVVRYAPQTTYRTVYRRMPVTVYRPNVTVMSPSGLPVTNYQGCTTYRNRVQRSPYTTCQPAYTCPSNPCAQPSVMGGQAYAGTNPYNSPAVGVPTTLQPGNWTPSGQSSGPVNVVPATPTNPYISPTPTGMNPLPSTPSNGSRFSTPAPATNSPGGSVYGNPPANVSPADNRPSLNTGPAAPIVPSTQMKPVSPTKTESEIKVQVVRPLYSNSSTPSPNPAKSSKTRSTIIPIPDPEVYPDVLGEDEAPELFNPNDKTAFLTIPKIQSIDWKSVRTTSVQPASFRHEVAKPRFDDSGWKSTSR